MDSFKIRYGKAYDRVEWDFLWTTLQAFGFNDTWIKWIKACVTTVSYSPAINNNSTSLIMPTRGLRQGDPLSPALFVICMEVLSRKLLMHSQIKKDGIGIKITPYAPTIPGLFFADDSLLFCKAKSLACSTLRDILTEFSSMSGQLINFQKSSIVFSKHVNNPRK